MKYFSFDGTRDLSRTFLKASTKWEWSKRKPSFEKLTEIIKVIVLLIYILIAY